jgi:hypothetical protein
MYLYYTHIVLEILCTNLLCVNFKQIIKFLFDHEKGKKT